ncbi:alkaline phosphatase [Conexibacter sp. CPCC 206217]|uniref:alkaline phosphatase D family protein n=1 Tax=Conexibacter sp. CPCC 206217 TaxID=3064574 RepID=UPI00271DA765|nr:alkaline phosphatase D family protein [Conexibacter sp. CPCC 206217]MDO8211728.1 alkaline phosphatase D family protein [Conexibacter sp. CPCC 206217]
MNPFSRPLTTTRRELIATGGGALLAGFALTTPAHARLIAGARGLGAGAFLDGVASGEPAPDAVTLWGRISSERPRTAARLIVASDPDLSRVVATALVPTSAAVDHTLKLRVGGLQPDTRYWYAWQSRDALSPIGRTKTAAPPDSEKAIVLGFSSCQRFGDGFFNAHADAAAREDLDLYALLGDYTYEYEYAGDAELGRGPDPASTDLTSYRAKLRLYRADAHLRELHRLHPVVHVWDDHEVADNYTDGEPAPSPQQRVAGYRASFEWMPRLSLPGDRYRLFRTWRLGRHAELFMLDERQYRDAGTPGTTLLGRRQLDWIKAGLTGSDASWKLVGNPVMIALLGLNGPGGGISFNRDQWDGYPAERDELLGHIGSGPIDDVAFLTGDIHMFFANHLQADSRPGSGSPVVATEYVGGSVTSTGIPSWLEGIGNGAIRLANPQIQYLQGAQHGWSVLRADAQQLRVDYRASDISVPGAPLTTIASFVQQRGANSLEQVAGEQEAMVAQTLGEDPAARAARPGTPLARRRAADALFAEADGRERPALAARAARTRTKQLGAGR